MAELAPANEKACDRSTEGFRQGAVGGTEPVRSYFPDASAFDRCVSFLELWRLSGDTL